MKELDLERAEDTVELIVDRDAAAGSKFRALLNDPIDDLKVVELKTSKVDTKGRDRACTARSLHYENAFLRY
jgi:hypothetical protein